MLATLLLIAHAQQKGTMVFIVFMPLLLRLLKCAIPLHVCEELGKEWLSINLI